MKHLIILLCFLVLSSAIAQSSAYTETYEVHEPRFNHIPTVCTVVPDPTKDNYLTDYDITHILREAEVAISEWKLHLQNKAVYHDEKLKWEINYIEITPENQKKFDYKICDVFITFEAKPKDKKDWYGVLGESQYETGNSTRTNIIIYYAGITFCMTQDTKYFHYNPCYSEKPRTTTEIANVIKHEFGHALGLGHFISDDDDINLKWARGIAAAPSIMAIYSHEVSSENIIHTIDIETVYSLYGEDGFIRNVTKPFLGFESFTTEKEKYTKDKEIINYVKIIGNVTSELYKPGQFVNFVLTKPDKLQEKFTTNMKSNAGFEIVYPIDVSTLEGKYLLEANYRGYSSNEISFEIVAKQENLSNSTKKIPSWIKNNAKWWSESLIPDNDFIEGIKFLITEKIIIIDPVEKTSVDSGRNIPKWVKTSAGWWATNQVTEEEFIRGMQYLVQQGIIILK